MPETVRSQIAVRVAGGPSLGVAVSKIVAGYDKLSVTVPAFDAETSTAGTVSVALQPAPSEHVEMLVIAANRYDDSDLSYQLGGEELQLDGPQLFVGSGMMSLFGSDLETIQLSNRMNTPVTVSVLVARNIS